MENKRYNKIVSSRERNKDLTKRNKPIAVMHDENV